MFKDLLKNSREFVTTLTVCVAVTLILAAFTGSASAKSINDAVDQRIDARISMTVAPVLASIDSKLTYLVNESYDTLIVSIDKQVDKLNKDKEDIKIADIESIMRKWATVPAELKTDDLIIKYNKIKDWYISRE